MLAVAAAVIGPGQWEAYQARALGAAVQGADASTFAGVLAQLASAAPQRRARVLADATTHAALFAHARAALDSRIAAPAYDFGRARALLAELDRLLPDSSDVTSLGKQLDAAERASLAEQVALRDRLLGENLLVAEQGSDNATAALERIRRIDPRNAALTDPKVGNAYLAAGTAALDSGRPELAGAIATAALAFTPNDARLAALKARAAAPPPSPDRSAPQILTARHELADVLAKPVATAVWAAAVHRLIDVLTPLVPADDPGLAAARRAAGATFVKAAAAARDKRRYADAASLLASARDFDPDSAELARESAALKSAQEPGETPPPGEQQRGAIESLKHTLTEQAAAGDVAGASATATSLRRVLAGSVYVSRDLPQILADAYAQLARTQLAAGHVDAALETLAAGRKKFGSAPQLKSLEARYVAIGDVYDRLSTAVKLNAAEQKRAVEALRAAEGADFPVAERMLAHTLANRIADERAAGRDTVAQSLLEAGREVFPGYAGALEQGSAGALPKTGIPVNVDESN